MDPICSDIHSENSSVKMGSRTGICSGPNIYSDNGISGISGISVSDNAYNDLLIGSVNRTFILETDISQSVFQSVLLDCRMHGLRLCYPTTISNHHGNGRFSNTTQEEKTERQEPR